MTKRKKFKIKRYTQIGKRVFEIKIYLNIDLEGTDHSACILNVKEV